MQNVDEVPQWYALQVRPQHEDMVSMLLRHKGYEEYLPSYRVVTSSNTILCAPAKKLFPGYVFCRFKYGETFRVVNGGGIITTPGVVRILGGIKPVPIPPEEITAIQRTLASRLKVESCPFLRTGMKVKIEAGPLRGLSGIVLPGKKKHRLGLSIEVLHRSVAVEIEPNWLSVTIPIREALDDARAMSAKSSC